MPMRNTTEHRRPSLRSAAAVSFARAAALASRLAGNQGTSLPGKVALSVSPDVLADLSGQVREKIFAVCGTNGKTSVNNILCSMLEAEGRKTVCNRQGANMLPGVTGAFLASSGLSGRLNADYACLEVDEASARHVFAAVKPDYLILTNLFRDQLDRYGEIDLTIDLLKKAVALVPEMTLVINADDPLSVYLAEESGNPAVYYGISERTMPVLPAGEAAAADTGEEIREGQFCKKCGAPLAYAFYHYSQMGLWRCPSCSFRRPEPSFEAVRISAGRRIGPSGEYSDEMSGGLSFMCRENGKDTVRLHTEQQGLYNIYNYLAVMTALQTDGHDCSGFQTVLDRYKPPFGRNEVFRIAGRRVILNLAKNPAGFNQNLSAMLEDGADKDLIIVINDNDQDGTDVSWLWDVEFEKLRDPAIHTITVSGIRALDMRLRLKYEDIPSELAETPEQAVEKYLGTAAAACTEAGGGKDPDRLYVLVNYTALFPVHRYLKKRAGQVS